MIRELNHFASLVKETSRAVSERANTTRIEMAKLRKTVQLQQQVRSLFYCYFASLCLLILATIRARLRERAGQFAKRQL